MMKRFIIPIFFVLVVTAVIGCRRVEPTQVEVEAEPEPTAVEEVSLTPENTPTVEPTETAEPTATAAPTETPAPILLIPEGFGGVEALVDEYGLTIEEANELVAFLQAAELGNLAFVSPHLAYLTEGDAVRFDHETGEYLIESATVFTGLEEVRLNQNGEITYYLTDGDGNLATLGTETLFWEAADGSAKYVFAANVLEGAFVPVEYLATLEEIAISHGTESWVVSWGEDDQFVANADDGSLMASYSELTGWEVPETWAFGPEERITNLLAGHYELPEVVLIADPIDRWRSPIVDPNDGSLILNYDGIPGGWEVVSLDSPRMADMNPHGVRILTPHEFYEMQKSYINALVTTAYLTKWMGTNLVLHEVTAAVPIASFELELTHHGEEGRYRFKRMNAYSYTILDTGEPALVIFNMGFESTRSSLADYIPNYSHFMTGVDGYISRLPDKLPLAWGSTEEFVATLIRDPNDPQMLLMFGNIPPQGYENFYAGNGPQWHTFEKVSQGIIDGISLADVTNGELFKHGPYSAIGLVWPEPLTSEDSE